MVVLRVDFARSRLSDSVKSEEFENQINSLRYVRAWTADGQSDYPRYPRKTIDQLSWALVGQGIDLRDAIYQLAHLVNICARVSPRGEALSVLSMLDGPLSKTSVQHALEDRFSGRSDLCEMAGQTLVVRYGDGSGTYEVSCARIPFLLALLEFVISLAVSDNLRVECDMAFHGFEICQPTQAALKSASNKMASVFSRCLKEVLRGRAEREQFGALTRFLDETAELGENGVPPSWWIDDESILSFWEQRAIIDVDSGKFRRFRTVHRAFIALCMALKDGAVWNAMHDTAVNADEMPNLIGAEVEDTSWETVSDKGGFLAEFDEQPLDTVRFLNNREARELSVVDDYWRLGNNFPLSALRSAVMGAVQNDLTTAQQFSRPIEQLLSLPVPGVDNPYADRKIALNKIVTHLERMSLAAGYVVAMHNDLDLPEGGEGVRNAFRGFRRQGFEDALESDERGEAFANAIAPLRGLLSLTEQLILALPNDLAALYAKDAPRFETVFRAQYGKEENTVDADPATI